MQIPTLADQRHNRCSSRQQRLDTGIIPRAVVFFKCGTEGGNLCVAPLHIPYAFEEFYILWVGTRPTTFNIVYTKVVQTAGDFDLVIDRKGDTFALRTISQSCVV